MERTSPIHETSFGLVREACSTDMVCILRMVQSLAAHHGDEAKLTSDDLTRDAFSDDPWISILVAEANGELAGYAVLCGLIKFQFGERGMDMHHLFVERGFRGLGIGRSIVAACKIKAASLSCRYLAVGTHPDNTDAQAFYTSLGFQPRDSHPPRFSIRLRS